MLHYQICCTLILLVFLWSQPKTLLKKCQCSDHVQGFSRWNRHIFANESFRNKMNERCWPIADTHLVLSWCLDLSLSLTHTHTHTHTHIIKQTRKHLYYMPNLVLQHKVKKELKCVKVPCSWAFTFHTTQLWKPFHYFISLVLCMYHFLLLF